MRAADPRIGPADLRRDARAQHDDRVRGRDQLAFAPAPARRVRAAARVVDRHHDPRSGPAQATQPPGVGARIERPLKMNDTHRPGGQAALEPRPVGEVGEGSPGPARAGRARERRQRGGAEPAREGELALIAARLRQRMVRERGAVKAGLDAGRRQAVRQAVGVERDRARGVEQRQREAAEGGHAARPR